MSQCGGLGGHFLAGGGVFLRGGRVVLNHGGYLRQPFLHLLQSQGLLGGYLLNMGNAGHDLRGCRLRIL